MRLNSLKPLFLILLLSLFVNSKGQEIPYLNRPVTIHASNVTIAELFQIISTQTGVIFSYAEPFDDKLKASINCDNWTLNTVLENLLKPLNHNYTIRSKYIIIDTHATTKSTQNIRGVVVDKVSQAPLPGATIMLVGSDPIIGASSNENGEFKLSQILIGKHSLKAAFIGYKDAIAADISVNSGKETIITIQLEEDITQMREVIVTANIQKNKPLNNMSIVSARTFSVEETQKFAAAFNDPARMATAFAGVISTGGETNNEISIRGNSPNGLLWRMEGIEIPNPNHFSNVGTSGGGVSILSAQVLGNSDFSTGAFAAEYGNALSGVFDLKLRKGNNTKQEYTIEAGILGLNVAAEGPIAKNYEGSYLINYRYSSLSLFNKIGVKVGPEMTNFQDLSFNISLPAKNLGTFSVFGFGGLSDQMIKAIKDSTEWMKNSSTQFDLNFSSNTGALGFTNSKLFNNNSYLKTVLLFSEAQNLIKIKQLQNDYSELIKFGSDTYVQNKVALSTVYTHKINAKSNFRTGVVLNLLKHDLNENYRTENNTFVTSINNKGKTQTIQLYFQYNYKLNEKITANAGIHYLKLFLNNTMSLEPRASLRYDITPKQNICLGYGLHSQLQPLGTYFFEKTDNNGQKILPNKNLGLSKANHFVFGYDININDFSHIKTEIYYQHLYNIPCTPMPYSYSSLNSPNGFIIWDLENIGFGKNYGVEVTYERFMHNNLYYLVTGTIFNSKYQASNNKWFNTMYNRNYFANFTIGKDWDISNEKKNRVVGINLKWLYVGGSRYTPIDLDASIAQKTTVYDETRSYQLKTPDFNRLDLRVSLKRNYKKITTTLSLDIQNLTNQKNREGEYFDMQSGQLKYWYDELILPIISYKIEF